MNSKNASAHTYHVVSNEDGLILAVYGSGLRLEAQASAHTIGKGTGCSTYLHSIVSTKRPRVGQSISMKGSVGLLWKQPEATV